MAGGVGLGGQSRQDALGVGRPCRRATPTRRAADGPPPCSRPRFPPSRTSRLRAPGPSRSSGWTPIARNSMETRSPRHLRTAAGRSIAVHARRDGIERLVLVRGRARLRQSAPVAGDDPDRPGDPNAGLCRGRPAIAALADGAADGAVRLLQAGRDRELRQSPPAARRVRPAAGRGAGGDFRLPRGGAGRWRRRVAGGGAAGLRLVPRRKRFEDNADRLRYGQLLGWTSSGSAEREQRRRIGAVLSARPRRDAAVRTRCR